MASTALRPLRKSGPRFEALERRDLLAGTVSVGVLNGQLVLLGDAASNGVTITQVADFPGQAGTPGFVGNFVITPDATTRLNQFEPGRALFITGATAGVSASLGAGADSLQFTGRAGSSVPAITVNAGFGDDILTFLSCDVSSDLRVTSPGGADRVSLLSSRVQGAVDVSGQGSLHASLAQSQAHDMFLKLEGVGSPVADPYLKIELEDVLVSGFAHVDTDSSLDFSAASSVCDRLFFSGDSSSTEYLKIKLVDVLVSSYVDVDVEGSGQLDFSARGGAASSIFIKFDGLPGAAPPAVSLDLQNVEVSSLVQVDTVGSLQAVATGQHIKKAVLFVRKQGTEQQDQVVELSELSLASVAMLADSSSLDLEVAGGQVSSVRVVGTGRTTGQVADLQVRLADVVVSSFVDVELEGDASVSARVSKIESFSIKQKAVSTSPPASLAIKLEDVLVSSAVRVEASHDLDLSSSSSSLGALTIGSTATGKHISKVDISLSRASSIDVDVGDDDCDFAMTGSQADRLFIKGENRDDASTCVVTLEDVLISSFASLDFHGGVDLAVSGGSAAHLSVHGSGGGAGKVSLRDFQFSSVDIETEASLAVTLDHAQGQDFSVTGGSTDSLSLNFTKIKFEAARLSSSLVVDVGGDLDLSSSSSEFATSQLTVRKQGKDQENYLKVQMEDLLVSSFSLQSTDALHAVSASSGQISALSLETGGSSSLARTFTFSDLVVSSLLDVDCDGDGLFDFSLERCVCPVMTVSSSSVASPPGSGGGGGGAGKVSFQDLHLSSVRVIEDALSSSVTVTGGTSASMKISRESHGRSHHIKLSDLVVSSLLEVDVADASLLDFSLERCVCPVVTVSSSLSVISVPGSGGGGSGKVSFQDLHLSSVHVVEDSLSSSVSVTGGTAASMGIKGEHSNRSHKVTLSDLLVSSLVDVDVADASLLDFSLERCVCPVVTVSSSSAANAAGTGGGGAGKVSFQDLHFASVRVLDDAQSSSVSVTGGQVASMGIKGESQDRLHVIKLRDVLVSGRAAVEVDGASSLDFSAVGAQCGELSVSSSHGSGGGAGKVSLQDFHFASLHVRSLPLQGRLFSVDASGGSTDSLQIKGESTDTFYQVKLSDLLVSSFAVVDVDGDGALDLVATDTTCGDLTVSSSRSSATGTGGGTGKVSLQDFHFATLRVLDSLASSEVSVSGGDARSLSVTGKQLDSAYTIKLADVLVSSFVDVDVDSAGPLDLTVTGSQCGALHVSSSSSSSQAAGSGGGAGKASFSDLSFSSVHLHDENGLLELSCSGGVLGSLVVEGAARAPSDTSPVYKVSLSDLTVTGALAVDTSSSLDFSMQSCFTGGVRVATGDIDGDGLDSLRVSLASCVSTGGVSVESAAALDFAADACRSASVFLKMGDIKSASPPGTAGLASSNSVRLSNGRVLGALTVLGSNSDDQVTLDRMVLSGATAVSLGGGQDRLAVVDSLFARFALFSGGNGSDELTLTRSRFVTTPIVIGFESLSS